MTAMLNSSDGLLVVDVQVDFCPGGALAVPEGDQVVPVLNRWISMATAAGAAVYASRDWHPLGHPSFSENGGPWPRHCVQDTRGAAFHPELKLPAEIPLVSKGVRFDKDQYSAFDETGFEAELRRRGVKRLWVGGLALDVCVKASALDAARLGFETHLVLPACRPVRPEATGPTLDELRAAGVVVEEQTP